MRKAIYEDSGADKDVLRKLLEAYDVDEILEEIRQRKQNIRFSFVEGVITLPVEEIIYIETNRHKNCFYTRTEVYNIYKKLDEIEAELMGMGFVRAHRSFLVNMRYIEKISSYVMRLTIGKEISVPKSRYQKVKETYMQFKEI